MGPLPIQRLFGSPVIGNIRGENGFGCQVIGKDGRNLMQFGFREIGNREEAVGSGIQDIGNTVKLKLRVES
jgi:hypothetical protein